MAEAGAFDWVCGELESVTSLSAIEARGTVRLALRKAGLDAKTVSVDEMRVVLEKVLPTELGSLGVAAADEVCARVAVGLVAAGLADAAGDSNTPESVFKRLGS